MTVIRWLLLLAGLSALVIFQTGASSEFPLFGVGPQVALVVLCCWAIVRPPIETLVMIPLAGIGLGLLAFQGMPESVAALAPIGLAALSWRSWRDAKPDTSLALEWAVSIALVGAASVMHFTVHAIAVELDTSSVDWLAAVHTVMLSGVLGNMIIGAIVYWFVRIPTARIATQPAVARSAWN